MATERIVLVIEDDSDIVRIVEFASMKLGLTTRSFAQAADFMAHPDIPSDSVVLLDLGLGDDNGVEILRFLAARRCAAPLFLMSGEDERLLNTVGRLGQSYGLDVRGILQKPFRLTDLMDAIQTPPELAGKRRPARASLAEQLHLAIVGNEFRLYFQPKIALSTGAVVGCEALVRWEHPDRGLLPPGKFLPLAEQQGLVGQITRWVLDEALRHLSEWRREGYEIGIAVNMPADRLNDIALPSRIQDLLERNRVEGSWLTLEVTEGAAMNGLTSAIDVLSRLRLMRVGLSIDDFGTGHSSIVKLRQLPFTELKIDRSFVQDMETDRDALVLIKVMIAMAGALGMTVVAEGVEGAGALRELQDLGCDLAQGFHLGRPMAAEDFLDFVRQRPHHGSGAGYDPARTPPAPVCAVQKRPSIPTGRH